MRYTLRLSIVLPLQKLIPIEKFFFSFSPLLLSLFHRPLALLLANILSSRYQREISANKLLRQNMIYTHIVL